jgi:hypothetical protein
MSVMQKIKEIEDEVRAGGMRTRGCMRVRVHAIAATWRLCGAAAAAAPPAHRWPARRRTRPPRGI